MPVKTDVLYTDAPSIQPLSVQLQMTAVFNRGRDAAQCTKRTIDNCSRNELSTDKRWPQPC